MNGRQTCCDWKCGLEYQAIKREREYHSQRKKFEKAKRAKHKEDKERVMTTPQAMKLAIRAFNTWVKLVDEGLTCIQCGEHYAEPIDGSMWDAGHFQGTGSHPEMRFMEDNCWREHSRCNRGAAKSDLNKRTSHERYREHLLLRIGPDQVALLEGPQEKKQYRVPDLLDIRDTYNAKNKELRHAKSEGREPARSAIRAGSGPGCHDETGSSQQVCDCLPGH